VVGDEDGVVSFPVSEAPALLDAVQRTAANEEAIKAEIATGAVQQSWLHKVLSVHACELPLSRRNP
jgi:regulator of RNase E activity RraA